MIMIMIIMITNMIIMIMNMTIIIIMMRTRQWRSQDFKIGRGGRGGANFVNVLKYYNIEVWHWRINANN